MQKGKLKDFLSATKQEVVVTALEEEALPSVVETVADTIVSEGTAMVLGGVIGAVTPRLNGIRLSYKQNRFERNVKDALAVMVRRIEVLEANYSELDETVQNKFNETYLEWLLDNLYEEKQAEKVSYHVNGFINLMSNDVNDNLMLMFFNTLNELTQLDIDVLAMYSRNSQDDIFSLCNRYNLLPEQVMVIKEKLARLGLLASKNDALRDINLDSIVVYLDKVEKDKKSRNPKGVKLPNIKKPNRSESFVITSLGNNYLKVISE